MWHPDEPTAEQCSSRAEVFDFGLAMRECRDRQLVSREP